MENQLNTQSLEEAITQPTFPDLRRLLPHQRTVLLEDDHRFKVLVWHRRARKTTTAISQLVKWSQLRVGVYWHIFPTYGEAKDAVWRDPQMLFKIIPNDLILKKNEQEMVVYFKNGSILQLKGSDDPDALRGAGPVGVVLDEFEKMKFYTWQIIEPILRANGGWAWFIGTPIGKNHLYDFFNRGQTEDKEWKSWILKASESGVIPLDQLEESKKTSTQAIWTQEYECEFLEGEGQVFRGVKEVMTAKPEVPKPNELYVMGVDLAKVTDFTVLRVYKRSNNQLVYSDRFNQLEWPFQKKRIAAIAKHYNNALCLVDATGIGDPIVDDLLRSGVAVEPIKITQPLKKELIEKLSIYIEQRKIRLIYSEEVLFEYDNFGYEITITGGIRYGARSGYHDDIVIADALAVWSLQPVIREEEVVSLTPIQKDFRSQEYNDELEEQREWTEFENI